jgi:alpha-1,6-mannosyltransferase
LFQILDATLASLVIVAMLIAITYRRLPWRPLPDVNGTGPPEEASGADVSRPPPAPATKSDAYAEYP